MSKDAVDFVLLDSQLDTYKHGAFLEKTDRFSKETPADVPGKPLAPSAGSYVDRVLLGPNSYNTEAKTTTTKPSAKSGSGNADRYAVLQRKVEDLERLHNEDKRSVEWLNLFPMFLTQVSFSSTKMRLTG